MKRLEQAKQAVVSAASDTRRAVIAVGLVAVAALLLAVLALGAALMGRRAVHA